MSFVEDSLCMIPLAEGFWDEFQWCDSIFNGLETCKGEKIIWSAHLFFTW